MPRFFIVAVIACVATVSSSVAQLPLAEPIQTLFNGTGLREVGALVASADGRHIYAAGRGDRAIVAFARNGSNGRLGRIAVYRDGVAGIRGIAAVQALHLSADEAMLFAGGGSTIAILARDPDSGTLALAQTIDGGFGVTQIADIAAGPTGTLYVGGSNAVALFTEEADGLRHQSTVSNSIEAPGLRGVAALDIGADDRFLHVASDGDRAVTLLEHDQGILSFVRTLLPAENPEIDLGRHRDLLISADGRHLYTAVQDLNAIAIFDRNPSTGELTNARSFLGEISAGTAAPSKLALSDDDERLYVVSEENSTVATLARNQQNGDLTLLRAVFDDRDAVTGITRTSGLALGPAQTHIYAAGAQDSAIAVFDAALTFIAVERNSGGAVRGMQQPAAVVVAPDGSQVITAGFGDGSLSVFDRNPDGRLQFSSTIRGSGPNELLQPTGLAISPDGAMLLIADFGRGAVHSYRRGAGDTPWTYADSLTRDEGFEDLRGAVGVAISPDRRLGVAISILRGSALLFAINEQGTLAFRGTMPALAEPAGVLFTGDGAHLYSTSSGDDAVIAFERIDGVASFPTIQTIRDSDAGVAGLGGASGLAITPEGNNVHVASGGGIFQLDGDNAIVTLARDPSQGDLTFVQALFDGQDEVSGIEGAAAVAVSPGSDIVAVAGFTGNSVALFDRGPVTGSLSFAESHFDTDGGLAGASALAFSPSGSELYVTGFADSAITVFRIRQPTPTPTSTPTSTQTSTPTPTATATPTSTPTATAATSCAGDCDNSGRSVVSELIRCVTIALSAASLESCEACDANHDGRVSISDLIQAVNAALNGCPTS